MPAPTWTKNKKVAVYPEGWSEEKTNLTPGTFNPYVQHLDPKDQVTLTKLANDYHMLKRNVLAMANLRQLYTNLANIRDIKGNVKVNLIHLMYDIVEAVLNSLATGLDDHTAKSFIFGHDHPKLIQMIENEKVELRPK